MASRNIGEHFDGYDGPSRPGGDHPVERGEAMVNEALRRADGGELRQAAGARPSEPQRTTHRRSTPRGYFGHRQSRDDLCYSDLPTRRLADEDPNVSTDRISARFELCAYNAIESGGSNIDMYSVHCYFRI